MKHVPWNRCDVCGRFIPFDDFSEGRASHREITPSSAISNEEWETLCKKHSPKARLES